MAKLKLVDRIQDVSGRCWHGDGSLWTDYERWYDQDVWLYYLDRIGCDCTARKEIITVGGYLQSRQWSQVENLAIPHVSHDNAFVIDEDFEPKGRVGSESVPWRITVDPTRRTLLLAIANTEGGKQVSVSPHTNLVIGATETARQLILSHVYFLDVPDLPC